jgi:membrane associated rhomboid family serine protease
MLDELNNTLAVIIQTTQANSYTLMDGVEILWGIFFITRFIYPPLLQFGIIPRHLIGLPGILCAPFLHANFNHLFYNTIPLVVLSNFLLIYGIDYYLLATVLITILSGVLIWLFGKPGIHIGASGLITGYWSLLVSDIYQQGSLMALLLGGSCIYAFAGIFLGIFPQGRNVSWEGHLFGFIAGLVAGYLLQA